MSPETTAGTRDGTPDHRPARLFRILVLQVIRPARAAELIHRRSRWLGACLVLVSGHLLISTLLLSSSIGATVANLPGSAGLEDRNAVAALLGQEHLVRSAFLPIRLMAGWSLFAAWVWLLTRAVSDDTLPRFRGIFGIVVHAELFGLLARAGVVLRTQWWSTGDRARDLLTPFSAAEFLPASAGHLWSAAAAAVHPFSAMYVLTVALGLRVACGFGVWKSTGVALIAWMGGAAWNLGLLSATRALLHGAP